MNDKFTQAEVAQTQRFQMNDTFTQAEVAQTPCQVCGFGSVVRISFKLGTTLCASTVCPSCYWRGKDSPKEGPDKEPINQILERHDINQILVRHEASIVELAKKVDDIHWRLRVLLEG